MPERFARRLLAVANVDETLLARARKYERAAIEELFAQFYPLVYRISLGLSGRRDVGAGIMKFVMRRALRVLPAWKDEGAPERWFGHHTVLTTRRAYKHQPKLEEDVLMADAEQLGTPYAAFIRALRGLPMQQREAFILHHGENYNARYLAVVMDCSVVAATQHLQAASNTLAAIAGHYFENYIAQVAYRYKRLTPGEALVLPGVKRIVGRWVWPRRIARVLAWLLALALVAGVAWFVRKIWPMLVF